MYRDLPRRSKGWSRASPTPIANMANAAALIWETLPDLNWAGFYRNVGGELVLGPFQGRPACIRIPFGKGVCGAAAATLQVQRVEDVHAFPGHIACDAHRTASSSFRSSAMAKLIAVLDLDSPNAGAVRRKRMKRAASRSGEICSRRCSSSTAPAARRSSEPGMIITGQGNLPASVPVKCATSGPGLPLGAAPSTSAATSCALADIFADDLDRLAAADRRSTASMPGLVHDFADRRR